MKNPAEWDTDEWVVFFLVLTLGGPLLVSRFVDLGPWLQRHQVLVSPAEAVLTVPGLGGFDVIRIFVAGAVLVLLVLSLLGVMRRWTTR